MLDGSAGATPAEHVEFGGARIERAMRRSTNAKSDKDFEFPCGTASTVMFRCSQHYLNVGNHTFGSCEKNVDLSTALVVCAFLFGCRDWPR